MGVQLKNKGLVNVKVEEILLLSYNL